MKSKFFTICVFSLCLVLSSFISAQPINSGPGKCLCRTSHSPLLSVTEEFHVFNGEYIEGIQLDSVYFFHESLSDQWIYLGYYDELTSAQQENEDKFYKLIEVLSLELMDSYSIDSIDFHIPQLELTKFGWTEVNCSPNPEKLFSSVAYTLNDLGFLKFSDIRDIKEIKKAIVNYQEIAGLAVNPYGIETLNRLMAY